MAEPDPTLERLIALGRTPAPRGLLEAVLRRAGTGPAS